MKSMCILGLMTERGNEEGGKTKHYGGGGLSAQLQEDSDVSLLASQQS